MSERMPEKCQKICQKRMLEDMSEKDIRKYVRKGCQKICPKKCHKERLYWTVSIEHWRSHHYISFAKHFCIFQILVPRRLGVWNCFESSVTRVSLSQLGQIDHSGHCWTPNQEKGRGGEDNSDEIQRPKGSRLIRIILSSSSSPDFSTKNVWICDKYVMIWCHGGDHSKWSSWHFGCALYVWGCGP